MADPTPPVEAGEPADGYGGGACVDDQGGEFHLLA